MKPPKHLYFDEKPSKRPIKPFRISQRNANRIQYGLILGVLLTTLYAFMNFKQGDIMSFFGSQAFIYVAISYVFIYILWQLITNKLSKFPIKIIKSSSIPRRINQSQPQLTTNRRASLISIIGYTLSMAFTLMVMIFLAVANLSGTGETHVIWNHFGELMFETILFVCAFVVTVIGYYFTYKNFKQIVKRVTR